MNMYSIPLQTMRYRMFKLKDARGVIQGTAFVSCDVSSVFEVQALRFVAVEENQPLNSIPDLKKDLDISEDFEEESSSDISSTVTATTVTSAIRPSNCSSSLLSMKDQSMTPDVAKVKCHKFLSTLLTASQRKSAAVVENVRELIQVRIGGRIMK